MGTDPASVDGRFELPRRRLSRPSVGGPAAPVRLVHLGLGGFFRAHQAAYTADAPDAEVWGYAAFTGRRPDAALALAPQQGLYTLVTRAAGGDQFIVVPSLSEVHAASDHAAWCALLATERTAVVTLTVTEAGYHRTPVGGLDFAHPAVAADLAALGADAMRKAARGIGWGRTAAGLGASNPVGGTAAGRRASAGQPIAGLAGRVDADPVPSTAVGRLVAGLAARRAADGGPLAVVPCDNLPGNGAVLRRLVLDLAEAADPTLAAWIEASVSFVATVVDRITPATTDADRAAVAAATGWLDASPVVTEPSREWVLAGEFPAGRPAWEQAGANVVADVTPFERRKLWLLNGAHSLLAYGGPLRGHTTVAEAIADDECRTWVEQWWDEAAAHLPLPPDDVTAYRAALVERFANPRIAHRLAQIAADGSQKLPVRVLPVLRAERAAGRLPLGAARILAAWLCHLRGHGAPVADPRSAELTRLAHGPRSEAVRRVLATLDPPLADDAGLVSIVVAHSHELAP